MEFHLKLKQRQPHNTISEVSTNGRFVCYTNEDAVREQPGVPVSEWKIKGATAIPAGRYEIVIDMSTRFGKLMPHLLDVPGFSGIRIHPGNTAHDTEGCLLPGYGIGPNNESVTRSREAYGDWFDMILASIRDGERCYITVTR